MKKIISFILVVTTILSIFTGCAAGNNAGEANSSEGSDAAPATEENYIIKLAHVEPGDSNENKGALKFKELLEEKSEGRITVEVYPAGQLGNENDLIESVKMNSIQITIPSAAAAARFYDPLNILMMPFYLDGKDELEKYDNLMTAIDSVWDDLNQGIVSQSKLRILAPFWYGDRAISNNVKPITNASDLQGLNIRVPDQDIYVQVFSAMGAKPTPIAFGELYMALSQGVVDGQDNPPYTDYVKNFYEVQKHLTLTGHITQIQLPLINETYFQSLPSDLQPMVIDSMMEAARYQSLLQAQANIDIVSKLEELGMTVSVADRDSFVEATKDIPSKMLDEDGLKYYNTLQKALEEAYR